MLDLTSSPAGFNLERFSIADMTSIGASLRRVGTGAATMEEVAGRVCRHLHATLADAGGRPACVLVRLFKTQRYSELTPGLQAWARGVLGSRVPWPDLRCLTLLGTAGAREEWNQRDSSRGHQAIPLYTEEFVNGAPMVVGLIRQLGLDVKSVVAPDPAHFLQHESRTFNVFHVPEALGSPAVPAQAEFVVPFGVRSVLAFGGVMPGEDVFAVILFTRVGVDAPTAELFKPVALSVKLALLGAARRVFS